jgi:Rod binding domain-containing protein
MTITSLPSSLSAPVQARKLENMATAAKDDPAARKAAEEFEQTFLTSMLESMFAGVETSAPFGGGHAEKQFRSVLLGEYAKDMAKSGGIGIADEVYREILAIQEGKV